MSGPFKMRGWSPFTQKPEGEKKKAVSKAIDPNEESNYEKKVKDAGLWSLYQKEGENAFTKKRGSYSPDVQAKIDKHGL